MARIAIYGLLNDEAHRLIRTEQRELTKVSGNNLALRMPVHITLRGPFIAYPERVKSVLRGFLSRTADLPEEVALDSPSPQAPDLAWRAVLRSHGSWRRLAEVHRDLSDMVRPLVCRDDVLAQHQASGFLPHVTLGWGLTLENWQGARRLREVRLAVRVTQIALARYPITWPTGGSVAIERIAC